MMKSIFESGKVMGYYAQIDFYYYAFRQLSDKLNKVKSPIEIAIDKATGFNEVGEIKKEAIRILKSVISIKKKIEADYSGDEEALIELKKIKVK